MFRGGRETGNAKRGIPKHIYSEAYLVKTMNEPKSVLIIDDDSDFVRAIQALLEASGHKVRSASNGRDGLPLAKTTQPDLILLDVMMSERTEGFFVLQEIRRIPALSKTPVIVLSSIYSDEPTFRVDPDAGWLPANLFLAKPVDPARLLTEVTRLMSESSKSSSEAGRR
jgi:CheY-like chemotaxis protein